MFPAAPERQAVALYHADWLRLRREIAALSGFPADFTIAGWVFTGMAAGAILASISRMVAYSQLPAKHSSIMYSFRRC